VRRFFSLILWVSAAGRKSWQSALKDEVHASLLNSLAQEDEWDCGV
jgi:hypothetical protein